MSGDDLSTLTVGEFLHTLRQVVAEKGANYVYPESERTVPMGLTYDPVCSYWHNGQPSCIIGHALDALGVAVPPALEGTGAADVLERFGAPVGVRLVADVAQTEQDGGRTWGEALAAAEAAARDGGAA